MICNSHKSSLFINRLFLTFIGITCLIFFCQESIAQTKKETPPKTDTLKAKIKPYHSPKLAAGLSAIIPGAGQVYNRKYWKLPIIYAGAGGLIYLFNANQTKYTEYRKAYRYRMDKDETTIDPYVGRYSDENLLTLENYYQRYRDLAIIGGVFLYTLNVIDAAVDAHLFTFDVSDDLSLRITPWIYNDIALTKQKPITGLSFNLSLKK